MKILSNKKYDRLIIEIETLKEIRENDEMCINMMADRINRLKQLEEENKKLKEKIELLDNENMCLNAEIKDREWEIEKLNEKVRFLEECLDNKEKLNEKYRKELKNYVYDAKQVRDIC